MIPRTNIALLTISSCCQSHCQQLQNWPALRTKSQLNLICQFFQTKIIKFFPKRHVAIPEIPEKVISHNLLPQLEGKYLFPKPASLLAASQLFRIIIFR